VPGFPTDASLTLTNVAPTVSDDESQGFVLGWRWLDTSTRFQYELVDSTTGAANWKIISPEGAVGGVSGVTLVFGLTKKQFTTITDAINEAQPGSIIWVGPGDYAESFTVPTDVTLLAAPRPLRTRITGSSSTGTRVTLSGGSNIIGFTVEVPDDAAPAVDVVAPVGERGEVISCLFIGNGGSGTCIRNSGDGSLGIGFSIYEAGSCDTIIEQSGNGASLITGFDVLGGIATTGLKVTGGLCVCRNLSFVGSGVLTDAIMIGAGNLQMTSTLFGGVGSIDNGVRITSDSATVRLNSLSINTDVVTTDVKVDSGLTTADFTWLLSEGRVDSIDAPGAWLNSPGFFLTIIDRSVGDEGFVTWGELVTGHAERGASATFGEGDAYRRGTVVITTDGTAGSTSDGGNLIDVSSESQSVSGSTFTMQGTGTNHSILFGSLLDDGTDVLKHWGVNLEVATGAVDFDTRSFVFEIWDGAAWVEIGAMSYHSQLFHRYGNFHLIRDNSDDQVLYGIDRTTTWAKKTINGQNLYWSRVRNVNALTSAPIIETVKLHPNHSEFKDDGTHAFFGRSRFRETLLAGGNQFGESGQVADATIAVGSGGAPTGWNHKVKNSQMTAAGDAIYAQFSLPRGVDTSFPLLIGFVFSIINGAGSDDASIVASLLPLETVGALVADPAGGIDPIPRPAADTESFTSKAALVDSTTGQNIDTSFNDRLYSLQFGPFDIGDYFEDDWMLVRLELDADGTDAIDLSVFGLEVIGVRWTHGAKL